VKVGCISARLRPVGNEKRIKDEGNKSRKREEQKDGRKSCVGMKRGMNHLLRKGGETREWKKGRGANEQRKEKVCDRRAEAKEEMPAEENPCR